MSLNTHKHTPNYLKCFLLQPDLARKFGEAVADNGKAAKNQVEPAVVSE
jgi:hypothetical protein